MPKYCIYLRKSRADLEAEAHGEGETLARHERMLLELAKRGKYNITQIYREIVSGETIAARPVMQQLLQEVEQGIWSGVLVVEVERLARGDTIDQGIMAQTFKYSGTKIITPTKVYDPDNEFDEEYFEFGLFMSRREYKTIKRRLQRGRFAAAREGKFVSGYPPYGYDRVRVSGSKGVTLTPSPLAENVRLIFRLFTSGEEMPDGEVRQYSLTALCYRLDEIGVQTPGKSIVWQKQSLIRLLSNPVYIGKIRWNFRSKKKVVRNGVLESHSVKSAPEDVVLVDGLHPPLISLEVFEKAQELLKSKRPPVVSDREMKNPLSGLLVCGLCGRAVIRNRVCASGDVLACLNKSCQNIGSYGHLIEEKLLCMLSAWLEEDALSECHVSDDKVLCEKNDAVQAAAADLAVLRSQLSRTHDLLEQGVYDLDTFLNRSRSLTERIAAAEERYEGLSAELAEDEERVASRRSFLPLVERLLKEYDGLSVGEKNLRLKQVLEKIEYTKTVRSYHSRASVNDFELVLYPKIPKR